jgi:hypothetical protein
MPFGRLVAKTGLVQEVAWEVDHVGLLKGNIKGEARSLVGKKENARNYSQRHHHQL